MPELLPVVDDEPKSGIYVDHDEIAVTDNEAAEGNAQGNTIDIDDDDDNGLDE